MEYQFTTYKGNLEGYKLNPGDLVMITKACNNKEYFTRLISTADAINSRIPDFRDVLYWAPQIITNKRGPDHLSFYSGDISGKYLVELQGISSNGQAGATSFILNVEK